MTTEAEEGGSRTRGRPRFGTYMRFACGHGGCNNSRPVNVFRSKRSGIPVHYCDRCRRAMVLLDERAASVVDWEQFRREAERHGETCVDVSP